MSELRQHLTDARDLIEGHGWVQKKFGTSGDGFCLVGSLVQASGVAMNRHRQQGLDPPKTREHEALALILKLIEGDSLHDVVEWNDREGRTREQVLELLETAIECTK